MSIVTVRELIAHLSKFPQDARVTIQMCSTDHDLELEDVILYRAEDRKIFFHHPNQEYMFWDELYKKPTDPDPEFVTVVRFPGH